jgi:hypothetical protein
VDDLDFQLSLALLLYSCPDACGVCPKAANSNGCTDNPNFRDNVYQDTCDTWGEYWCSDIVTLGDGTYDQYRELLYECPYTCDLCEVNAPAASSRTWTAAVTIGSAAAFAAIAGLLLGRNHFNKKKQSSAVGGTEGNSDDDDIHPATSNQLESMETSSAVPTNADDANSTVVCRCQSQLCDVCNKDVESTKFVSVSGGDASAGGETRLVVPTFEDMNKALFDGNWTLVAAIAEEIERDSRTGNAFDETRLKSPANDAENRSLASNMTGLKSLKVGHIERFIAEDEWLEVAEIARELVLAEEKSAAAPKESKKRSAKSAKEVKARVVELVTKIAPEELSNVDAMLAEFDGREEELVDQLTSIHERSIAGQSRVVAQSKAKKAARKTVKAKKKAASVSEITTVDVDGMVVKGDWAGLKALAEKKVAFKEAKRTLALDNIQAQKSDLLASLFMASDFEGIGAACTAFSEK